MSAKTLNPTRPAAGRRWRYALQSFALLFAVTSCCAFAVILADRFPKRYDVTATREHQLSRRTLDLLASLQGQYELVVAGSFSGADPLAARRTEDVLANFSRASTNIRTTAIDVGSARGMDDLDALLSRLVDRYKPELEKQRAGATKAVAAAAQTAQSLTALSDDLLAVNQTVKDEDKNAAALRRFASDSAAVCRVLAQNAEETQKSAEQMHDKSIGRTTIPMAEEAAASIRRSLANALTQLREIGDGLDALAKAAPDAIAEVTRDRAKPAAAAVARTRDEIGRALTTIDDLPRTPLASVARVLERSSAAIVIGPPPASDAAASPHGGVTTLDIAALFPPKPTPGSTEQPIQLDLRARTEELLSAAIAAIARDDAPIVILLHGEPKRIAPEFAPFAALGERLKMRGITLIEWAAALDADPPALTAINPSGKRPVVFVTLSTGEGTADAAGRMKKIAASISRLIAEGKPVLLSVNPSSLPGSGQKDPMVEFLEPLGVQVDSGRPLLQQAQSGKGREVTADLFFADPAADHAVSSAIRGVNTRLPWPIPLRIAAGANSVTPILATDNANRSIWAESEWMDFRRIPPQDRTLVANPPANDTSRDDGAGPWNLALAVDRSTGGKDRQRLVVVGSNGWFLDAVTQPYSIVDGRPVLANPGNLELFEASVFWLANQESLIGTSAQAAAAPLIPPLSPEKLGAIRWSLIGGLPLLILLIGAIWRLIRG